MAVFICRDFCQHRNLLETPLAYLHVLSFPAHPPLFDSPPSTRSLILKVCAFLPLGGDLSLEASILCFPFIGDSQSRRVQLHFEKGP